ncbi:MAG: sugar ABC transporter substrate-binding protein [Provencibacterium sp.]|jgi:multiple sugar transport system substrate-binding protein|nr:sugar ABC transporter substrate-binding protein [Provencibacterium sp.]
MKKNRKASAAAALVLLLSLCACSGGQGAVSSEAPAAASSQESVPASSEAAEPASGAPAPEDISGDISWLMRSNPFENEWEQQTVIPKFQETYKNVKVNMIIVPQDQVDPKLLSMQAAGTPPDVFSMWGDSGFMDYYNKDLLLELSSYIDRDINKEEFIDGIFDIYAVDGHYFHVPQVSNFSQMIVYNKTLFGEAGLPDLPTKWNDPEWTWEKMVDYARQLTKNTGAGADAQYGLLLPTSDPHLMLYQFGLDPFPEEAYRAGVMDKTNFDDPAIVETLQKWADLIYVEKIHPTPADQKALEQMGPLFKTGKVAMTTSLPTQAYGNFKDCPFEWGLAPMPAGAPGKARGILYNGAYFISKGSKSPEAAWALIKYMLTPEAAKDMCELTGFLVPLRAQMDGWFAQMSEATGMSAGQVEEAVTGYPKQESGENINHIFCGYNELRNTYVQGLDPLWLGSATAQEAISGFIGDLNSTAARIKADTAAQ